jgi:hypothetical protein
VTLALRDLAVAGDERTGGVVSGLVRAAQNLSADANMLTKVDETCAHGAQADLKAAQAREKFVNRLVCFPQRCHHPLECLAEFFFSHEASLA